MNRKNPTLEGERRHARYGMVVLVLALLSGLSTHLIPLEGFWKQWMYIAHILSGLCLAIWLIPYSYYHVKRILGIRRFLTLVSGIVSFALILMLAASGLYVVVRGQTETTRWIYQLHIYIAYSFAAITIAHLLLHRYIKRRSSTAGKTTEFQTLGADLPKRLVIATVILMSSILLLTAGHAVYDSMNPMYIDVENYDQDYGSNPFAPSETRTPNNNFVALSEIANSRQCGTCHKEIYEQWRDSLHGQAASDITYERNVNLLVDKKGIAAARYCEGCHAPVALLTGTLTTGGTHGGMDGIPSNLEGVSCVSCHRIKKVLHVKGNASYFFEPERNYLFYNSSNFIARKIHNFLIRIKPQAHRREMAMPPLRSPKMCASCHAQFMDKEMNGFGWIKMQDEYAAWLSSSFSGQSRHEFAGEAVTRCQDCHMPLVKGSDPSSNSAGLLHSHRTPAANTAIPYLGGDRQQFEATKKFLQSDKIRVHIDPPAREDAVQSSQYVNEAIRARSEQPYYYYLGEKAKIDILVTNHNVGHEFPGGTTDINQAWLSFRVIDAANQVVFESGKLDEQSRVDPNTVLYHALAVDEASRHVWKHDLFRMAGYSYKRVIPPGGTDNVEYTFDVPSWAKSPLTISATLRYRKFNNRYARWALEESYRPLPIVDMASDTLSVPLFNKPPAKASGD